MNEWERLEGKEGNSEKEERNREGRNKFLKYKTPKIVPHSCCELSLVKQVIWQLLNTKCRQPDYSGMSTKKKSQNLLNIYQGVNILTPFV